MLAHREEGEKGETAASGSLNRRNRRTDEYAEPRVLLLLQPDSTNHPQMLRVGRGGKGRGEDRRDRK